MAETAGAEDRNQRRGSGSGNLDRLEGRDAGTGQRSRVEGIDLLRDADHVPGVAERVLGEAAVDRVARVELRFAKRLPAFVAIAAVAAGISKPRQGDPRPPLDPVVVAVPQRDDPADPLVPGDEGRARLDRPLAAGGMDVGMAEAAGLDLDQHLLGPRLGDRNLVDAEWALEVVNNRCLHR